MKLKRSLQHVTTCKSDAQKKKNGNALVHNFVALSACATLAMILAVGTKVAQDARRQKLEVHGQAGGLKAFFLKGAVIAKMI